MLTMNVSYEYLLKSGQLTWENAEVIDNFFGPVALEVKNENWKEAYEASYDDTDGCINDSLTTQQGCQRGYEKTEKKIYVHLDHNKVISVSVALAPVDLDVNTKKPSRPESILFTEGEPLAVADPSKRSQGDDGKKCTIFHKKFTCKSHLTQHLRSHTGEKPFSCPQCEKKFAWKHHLKTHLLIHSGIKKFSCDICHRKFTDKSNLTVHRHTHTGDKSFECSKCNAMFSHKSNLTVHHRTHTGDKPFKCSVCNAMFSRSDSLSLHMRTHTGETPYQCEICERKFTLLRSLKRHHLIHSEEKPFACTYANCEKAFREKGDLQTHVRVHTKDKPYSCPNCHKTFSHSGSCRRHTKQCSVAKSVSSDSSFVETWEK